MASKQFNSVDGYSIGNATVVVDANANITAAALTANGNVSFTGANVSLGAVGNLKITGGSSGLYLQTDGSGNLSWQTVSVSTASISNGNSNVNIPAANGNVVVSINGVANIATFTSNAVFRGSYGLTGAIFQANTAPSNPQPGDQWYNTFNGILFEYLDDGTSSQWVDIGSIPYPNVIIANASAVLNNVQTTGTYYPAFISSTANGNYSLNSNTAFSANIANGALIATTFVGALSGAATTAGTVTTAAQPNITSVGTLTSLGVNGTVTAVAFTANTGVFTGNGSGLSAIAGANVTGTVSAATTAGTVTTAAQPNITSVGTLGNLSVTANITGGNLNTSGNVNASIIVDGGTGMYLAAGPSGYINFFTTGGDKASISDTGNITASNIIANSTVFATTANVSGNVNAGNVSATTLSGNVISPVQSSITSLGTLTGLAVNGNITAANITANTGVFTGNGSGLTDIAGANVTGTVPLATNANAVLTNTSTATTVYLAGTSTAANSHAFLEKVTGIFANMSNNSITATTFVGALSGAATSATTAGTVTTAAQPNVTSVGTLSSLSVTGNVAAGNLTTAGVLSVTGTGVSSIAGNLDMTSNTIINLATPTNPTDAATKQYVDDIAQGLHTHDSCNAATQTTLASISGGTVTYNNGASGVGANLTTTGSFTTIDGVTLSNGMRILVKNEANSAHNGIYDRTSTTVLTRSDDFNTPTEMAGGDFTFVTAGTLYDNTGWVMTDAVTTVGTSPVDWVQFSGAGTYTAGTGLTLTGTAFSVNASQSQITSVGTLTGLTSSGTITAPAFTANTGVFTGNGSALTALNASNVSTGTLAQARLANSNVILGSTTLALGTTTTTIAGLSSVTSTTFVGSLSGAATTAGTVTTAAQPNITSTGTLTGLTVSGTTSLSTASGYVSVGGTSQFNSFKYNQDGGALGTTAGNQVRHATYYSSSTNADYLEITNTRYTNGTDWTTAGTRLQQKIDATWMGYIQFNGAVGGGITFGTGTTTVGPTSIPGRIAMDSSGNFGPLTDNTLALGGAGSRWVAAYATTVQTTALTTGANTTAGTVTGNWTLTTGSRMQATYADLAEKYVADATYEPGTVLAFGGEQEVTLANTFDSTKVAGVVTTNPAYSMNAALEAEHVAEIALQGRVPCKVIGPVEKGDLMVSAINGHAIANNEARAGTIIGKALENFTGELGIIEVAVGRF